ncbi:hypothetical protein MKW98_018097 [Papaver atlanticum]|uniref:Uncharacterized protein n=1 Tax=Papaver atlanticum TaxID=357466 RepID=A0AAD4TFD0_9MAGN|nr:hypothetical protein MKW98_018097 [Papaver atlanticum]
MTEKNHEEDETRNPNWAELTSKYLTNILSRLSLEERWTGPMFVCKSWIHACKDPCFFSVVDLESIFYSKTESSLWWSPEFERKIDSLLIFVVNWSGGINIKEIRIRHCSDQSLSFVAQRCPNLQVLSIKCSPNVNNASIGKIASHCPMLTELDIGYCYEISHESLELIGSNCPNLKILKRYLLNSSQHVGIVPNEYLNACPQDGNVEVSAIGKFMPNLEHLEIRFSKLTVHALATISEGCVKLEYWDLCGCANLTSRDIENASTNLKNMKRLEIPPCYVPRDVFSTERYGHWRLYDERFQPSSFQI